MHKPQFLDALCAPSIAAFRCWKPGCVNPVTLESAPLYTKSGKRRKVNSTFSCKEHAPERIRSQRLLFRLRPQSETKPAPM
jgi:hypothetical protein